MGEVVTIGEDITLYCGDMEDILPAIEPFDAIVSDPPYGIGETTSRHLSRGKLASPRDYGDFQWDKTPASPAQIALMQACSRWQIIFGGNYFPLPPTSCWLIWDKCNSGDFADCELAWTNLPQAVRLIRSQWNGMLRHGNEPRLYPTQKPLRVMEWCCRHLPKDCQTICDPFMGSATTGVAAVALGKRFVGIDTSTQAFDLACARLDAAHRQGRLLPPRC